MDEPQCPYFGVCNGCSAQHLSYELQVENKKKVLVQSLRCPEVLVFTGEPYSYRNRMDFLFHKQGVGLRKKNSSEVVHVYNCCICVPKINQLMEEVQGFFRDNDAFDFKKKTGTFLYAVIRVTSPESSISIVLNEDSSRTAAAIEKVKKFAEKTTADNIIVTYVSKDAEDSISSTYFVVKGKSELQETLLDKKFCFSVQGFFQNNLVMAEKMQEYVQELLKQYQEKKGQLLDLYGGVGTFGICNAESFFTVKVVEEDKTAVDFAKKNILINKTEKVEAINLDAKQLRKLNFSSPLFVITDPPRSGMDVQTIRRLNELQPEVIIYVSCNVQQLAKGLKLFKNYTLKSAALFDLFPQTNHLEAVAELVREG